MSDVTEFACRACNGTGSPTGRKRALTKGGHVPACYCCGGDGVIRREVNDTWDMMLVGRDLAERRHGRDTLRSSFLLDENRGAWPAHPEHKSPLVEAGIRGNNHGLESYLTAKWVKRPEPKKIAQERRTSRHYRSTFELDGPQT